jgi:hypothetical protein
MINDEFSATIMQFRDEYIRDSELVGKAVADSVLMGQSAAWVASTVTETGL